MHKFGLVLSDKEKEIQCDAQINDQNNAGGIQF